MTTYRGSGTPGIGGIGSTLAFDDDAHGSRSGGSLHSLVTTTTHGFMSYHDKNKLDLFPSTFSAFAGTLLDDADAAAARSTLFLGSISSASATGPITFTNDTFWTTPSSARTNLGLAIGTNVQAYDATLQSLSSLGTAADKTVYTTGIDTWAETALTAFGRSLIDDAAASDARTTLGLGTIATQASNNVTVTGGSITGITDLAVADGGTGVSTISANAVVLGNGTAAIQTVAPGTSGNVLTSNGTTWTSATPIAPFVNNTADHLGLIKSNGYFDIQSYYQGGFAVNAYTTDNGTTWKSYHSGSCGYLKNMGGSFRFMYYNASAADETITWSTRFECLPDGIKPYGSIDLTYNAVTTEYGRIYMPSTPNLSANAYCFDAYVENYTPLNSTGLTTTEVSTATWTLTGNVVNMRLTAISGTSNATTFTLGTLTDSEMIPSGTRTVFVPVKDNGGAMSIAVAEISSGGVITLYKDVAKTAFTNSGTKALGDISFSYNI